MYPSSDNFDYSAFAAGQQFGRTMASLQQAPANPGLQPGSSVPDAFSAGQQMGANLKGGAQLAGNTLQAMQATGEARATRRAQSTTARRQAWLRASKSNIGQIALPYHSKSGGDRRSAPDERPACHYRCEREHASSDFPAAGRALASDRGGSRALEKSP